VCRIRSQKIFVQTVEKVIYGQSMANNVQSILNLNRNCKVLARERRQTGEFQYYEKQEECLYGLGIADLR